MNEFYLSAFKSKLEDSLQELLFNTWKNAQNLPEMMHGMMVMNAAGNFCKNMKESYFDLKKEFENQNKYIGLTEQEYINLIDEITNKVLDEFIEPEDEDDF